MSTLKNIEKKFKIIGKNLTSAFKSMFANKEQKEFRRLKDFLTL